MNRPPYQAHFLIPLKDGETIDDAKTLVENAIYRIVDTKPILGPLSWVEDVGDRTPTVVVRLSLSIRDDIHVFKLHCQYDEMTQESIHNRLHFQRSCYVVSRSTDYTVSTVNLIWVVLTLEAMERIDFKCRPRIVKITTSALDSP